MGASPAVSASVTIREASGSDVASLATIVQRAVEGQQRLAGYYELEPGFDWVSFVSARISSPQEKTFVAERAGQLVGFTALRIAGVPAYPRRRGLWERFFPRGSRAPRLPLKPVSWGILEDCFVREEFRGRGVGRSLVSQSLEWFKGQGVERVELAVLTNNGSAERFWRALGFEPFRLSMGKNIY